MQGDRESAINMSLKEFVRTSYEFESGELKAPASSSANCDTFLCFHRHSKQNMIVKEYRLKSLDPKKRDLFIARIKSFIELQNPFTPIYDNIVVTRDRIFIALSYNKGYFLKTYLFENKRKSLSEKKIKYWLKLLLISLHSIHQKGGYHGNISVENILIMRDRESTPCFGEFGFVSLLTKGKLKLI